MLKHEKINRLHETQNKEASAKVQSQNKKKAMWIYVMKKITQRLQKNCQII